jgi:hypothetical protein
VFLCLAQANLAIYGLIYEVNGSSFYVGHDAWATVLIASGLIFFWLFVNYVTLFQVEFYLGRAKASVEPAMLWMYISIALSQLTGLLVCLFHVPGIDDHLLLRALFGVLCLMGAVAVGCLLKHKHDLSKLFAESIALLEDLPGKEEYLQELEDHAKSIDSFLGIALMPCPLVVMFGNTANLLATLCSVNRPPPSRPFSLSLLLEKISGITLSSLIILAGLCFAWEWFMERTAIYICTALPLLSGITGTSYMVILLPFHNFF